MHLIFKNDIMISIDGLAVEFGGTTLFSDISFVINEKDRIALMGKNGAGKSTLLKILAGVRQPTRGKISAPKDCVIAYLPQHLMTEDGRTVFQETAQAFAHLHEMEAEIDRMNKELETRTDYESDSYMELIEQVSALSEKFYAIDATNYEEDVEKAYPYLYSLQRAFISLLYLRLISHTHSTQKIQVRRAFRPQGSGFGVRTEMVGNRRLGKQSKPLIQSVTHPYSCRY